MTRTLRVPSTAADTSATYTKCVLANATRPEPRCSSAGSPGQNQTASVRALAPVEDAGAVHLARICKVAGLGGDPYRDGSYDYYVGTEVVADDPKGVGAFILASAEQPN